jgi:acid phosphatase
MKYLACLLCAASLPAAASPATVTPIEHVIVVVGENRTFDNLFATWQPRSGAAVWNLLSRGIVQADGTPGPNFSAAAQKLAKTGETYSAKFDTVGSYDHLPQPYAAGAFGQRRDVPDARFPADLANGPFQISRYVGYGAHTGDPVHRFFQMWQQVNGGASDLFVWTAETAGAGSDNGPYSVLAPGQARQGGVAMGFYNMAQGDAPYFRELADRYAVADNYHQPIMGGTTANYFALASADVGVYLEDGRPARPPQNQIENPDPRPGSNNIYAADGFIGGTYVNCSDPAAPGVVGIRKLLAEQPYRAFNDGNCAPGHYYMVNNLDPDFKADGTRRPLGPNKFLLPPQTLPHIGDLLSKYGVSWKWYSGGRNDSRHVDKEYCGMCDTPTFFASTMTGPDKARLQDLQQFYVDVKDAKTFPAVSFIAPYDSVSGHPGYAMETGFEELVHDIVERVQANPELWKKTAILVTTDEGGGYYDSGYVQFIDFFGDGTRIPLIVVSPLARKGHVDHTYYDHASILKFIERNWRLPTLSARSRDNLPNPVADASHPYVPSNRPAIGDLMNLFELP